MSFIPKNATSNNWRLRFFPKVASVAFSNAAATGWANTADGFIHPMTATLTKFAGIIQKVIAATDSDYASNTLVPVLVPTNAAESTVIATTASAVVTDVGVLCDLTNSLTVNRGASAVRIFIITKYLSATSVEGYFLMPALTATT